MSSLKEKLFEYSPDFFHNFFITLYNLYNNNVRFSGSYKHYKKELQNNKSYNELRKEQLESLNKFIKYSKENSDYYNKVFRDFESINKLSDIKKYSILTKDTLKENIDDIITVDKKNAILSKTGGTTGKSLKVYYTKDDVKKRFATLDNFRESCGYKLGKKTAWFSGKNLVNKRNLKNNIFWKYDFLNKIRYYSTFHCSGKHLEYIMRDLIKFSPKILSGFPSSISEIARYGSQIGINIEWEIDAIFTTAEALGDTDRKLMERFFKTKVYDQYASSEGAPFIFECEKGNYHIDFQSGLIEVLDDEGNDSNSGRMIVTSFQTHGTPLIRYDIGDSIVLSDKKECPCGNQGTIVDKILGRSNDYILSKSTGKISAANMSNVVKEVDGILQCQLIQNNEDSLDVLLVVKESFNQQGQGVLEKELRNRLGNNMELKFQFLENIPKEKSGKFRFIKNNLL